MAAWPAVTRWLNLRVLLLCSGQAVSNASIVPVSSASQELLGEEQQEQILRNGNKGLPWNFSWLEAGVLAGSSVPLTVQQLEAMVREGVSHLVSLSPEEPPPAFPVKGLTVHYLPVRDFTAPSLRQLRQFVRICRAAASRGEAVAVHCRGGTGRTGTLLAAWLVWSRGLRAGPAVARLRRSRPGSVECRSQARLLERWWGELQEERREGVGEKERV